MSLPQSAAGGESCLQDSFLPYRKVLRQKEHKLKCRRHFFMRSPVRKKYAAMQRTGLPFCYKFYWLKIEEVP